MRIPILLYHSISRKDDGSSVSVNNFYKQMKTLLKLGYKSVNLKDILLTEHKKKFVITFDDAYEEMFENVFPILKELNLKATCFVVTRCIGKINFWDKTKLDYSEKKIMNEQQIIQWHKSGLEIGSHTLDHENLTKITSKEKISQICESKKILEQKIAIDIKSFSYPYGRYDDESIKIVKDTYSYAVTTKRARFKVDQFNKIQIPRIPINADTSIYKFLIKVLTFYEDIKFKT